MKSLFKKLKHLSAQRIENKVCFTRSWDYVMLIKKLYRSGELKLVESEWGDRFRRENDYNLDLMTPKQYSLWSTFAGCVDIYLQVKKNNKIDVIVKIYDGDSFDGHRTKLRWQATFTGFQRKYLKEFGKSIEYEFKQSMYDLFQKEEELRMQERMKELAEETLSEL